MVTRSLTLLAAACLVTAAFAQNVVTAQKVEMTSPLKNVHVTVGPDGIGRVDGGVTAQASTQLPLYSVLNGIVYNNSYWYFTGTYAEGWMDAIGVPAPAKINGFTIAYHNTAGTAAATVDVDLIIYDSTGANIDDAEIYERGCSGIGGLAIGAYTIQGLPGEAGGWIVTVDVSALPTVVNGRFWIQHGFYNHSEGGTTGIILAGQGHGEGVPMGRYVEYGLGKANYDFTNSGSDSQNVMYSLGLAGCYWFGGKPNANFGYEFTGQYAFRGELKGDFGLLGSVPQFPKNTCYVTVTDSTGASETNLVYLYGDGGNEFSLPFSNSGPYTIRVEGFNGYLSRSLANVTPDPVNFSTVGVFNLRAGDANGDNTVNIADLNTVLINFGQSGN